MIEISGVASGEPDGALDEVFGSDCRVHLERISDQGFCLIIDEQDTGRQVIINLWTKRARIGAFIYEDTLDQKPKPEDVK